MTYMCFQLLIDTLITVIDYVIVVWGLGTGLMWPMGGNDSAIGGDPVNYGADQEIDSLIDE